MTTSSGGVPYLRDVDLRHLEVFRIVADCGGLSAAQVELNLSLSTISLHVGELEGRLGMRLCQRGRGGFALTPEGRIVYKAYARLGSALQDFRSEVGSAREQLTGELSIAVVDSTVTDANSPVVAAIRRFQAVATEAEIRIHVQAPKEIERGVLDRHVHVGIGKFYHRLPELEYRDLYSEELALYCAREHPLFERAVDVTDTAELAGMPYVSRGYVTEDERPEAIVDVRPGAIAYQLEGIAMLILSGCYIGFLPTHYAAYWVERDDMRPLLSRAAFYRIGITAITRRNLEPPPVVRAFLDSLLDIAGSPGQGDRESMRLGGSGSLK